MGTNTRTDCERPEGYLMSLTFFTCFYPFGYLHRIRLQSEKGRAGNTCGGGGKYALNVGDQTRRKETT